MNKRFVVSILLCITLIVSMCACGTGKVKMEGEYASQEAFLEDLAAGIELRTKKDNSAGEKSGDALYKHYEDLTNCELGKIEKYENLIFEDKYFDALAHSYIDACQMQRTFSQNYKISELATLWSSGFSVRSALIREFYSRYNLPISEETYANYAGTSFVSVPEPTDYTDCVSVKELGLHNNSLYTVYLIEVKNESAGVPLDLSVNAVFYDKKGNIVGAEDQVSWGISEGDTFLMRFGIELDESVAKATYQITEACESSMRYSDPSGFTSKETQLDDKIIVEITNTSDHPYEENTVWCVFYNKNKPIDYTTWTSVATLNPGERVVAELKTYTDEEITSYKVYYQLIDYR